jgi:2-polyprenyl-3-methyl-5-hydroxy-6-metoxy-1,4-benzoquinol methylase
MSGWDTSAAAWIDLQGEFGDFGRVHVLDAPMLALVDALAPATVLDVGCGEGRFCRMLEARGLATTGVDPTAALIERARALHPQGDYRVEGAEAMTVGAHDLVVCYLSLIDMPDLDAALTRIVAAIRPGGHLLIANLTAFNTAAVHLGWVKPLIGEPSFPIDHYLEERPSRTAWRGVDIVTTTGH